jgi:glycerol-3-phosphate dehydrogenase (NAD(P)+)
MKITVLGAGNMGTTIAHIISSNGHDVALWNYEGDPEPLEQIKAYRENKKYLPGIKLSSRITVEPDLEVALHKSTVVFFVVPSSFMSSIVARAEHFFTSKTILVDVSKGFGEEYLQDPKLHTPVDRVLKNMVAISGPAIAVDLAREGFTAMNIASENKKALVVVKKVLETHFLILIAHDDVKGIKLCGALKNVYAILLGVCDGLQFPMNTKAFLLTKALEEMGKLVGKLGGKKETVYSLAGLGDLVGTGLCTTSRNRRFGEFLVCATSKADAESQVGQVVEGAQASKVLRSLAKLYHVDMPLARLVYEIVWLNKNPKKELTLFLKGPHVSKKG